MNILVSTICFINFNKTGADIYATYANRLIEDVMIKTPYDIMVSTNAPDFFKEKKEIYGSRVIINFDSLDKHKVEVKAFNQLLKFFAIQYINPNYDYVLYLDCDAGLTDNLDINQINNQLLVWDNEGYDMFAVRTNATYIEEEEKYYRTNDSGDLINKSIFYNKFDFYGINPEYRGACLPSEHILLMKNNEKLAKMAEKFEEFCFKYETQDKDNPKTVDMEAFEIGVSAFVAGYKVKDLESWGHHDLLKVGFNYNNWENIKL
jgi:hypothetical protein